MTFIWTGIALISLMVLGILGFAWLIRNSKTPEDVTTSSGLTQLLNKRQNSDRYKTPILFFGLFVSTLYAFFAFDASYNKIVEKKLYAQKPEVVDTLIAYIVSAPPPPPKPIVEEKVVVEEKVEVPEIKLVEKIKETKTKEIANPIDPTASGPPGPPVPPNDNRSQVTDDKLYFPGQYDNGPGFKGDFGNYLFPITENVKPPNNYRIQGKKYQIVVTFVVEKDGSISDVRLPKNCEIELKEHEVEYIKSHLAKMPKWSPAMYLQKPVRSLVKQPIVLQ